MKKILSLVFVILLSFTFIGCNEKKNEINREKVAINLPSDNSVNGYRTEKSENIDDTVISAEDVTVIDKYVPKENSDNKYCVNKNSGVFHKISCDSVSKMKETNKIYLKDKSEAILKGYKACKICNP
ncbi:MAG: hypothetical protein IKT38_07045 [Clostridia bacterium]|nr:hypothetical protein [Clostridia bacterium]